MSAVTVSLVFSRLRPAQAERECAVVILALDRELFAAFATGCFVLLRRSRSEPKYADHDDQQVTRVRQFAGRHAFLQKLPIRVEQGIVLSDC